MSIYDFKVTLGNNEEKSLAEYKGKVILIVNTASKCGFTSQFKELQEIYTTYQARGFEILGFPCNQFAAQELETNEEVQQFCQLNYGVTFQIFAKGDVRGETAQPLFKYLTSKKKFEGFDMTHPNAKLLQEMLQEKFPEYLNGNDIKWNFTKFLVGRNSEVVARFEPTTLPKEIAKYIEEQL